MIFTDKNIVVMGGTGSLGKVLVRRILGNELGAPKKIVVFSRDEGKQHAMRQAYLHQAVTTDEVIYQNFMRALQFQIGDVCNYGDVCTVLRDADIVINAAALKQVPTCEYFPVQAVRTNCLGAENIVRAIHNLNYPVDTVLGVSTDKACKPVNTMGMTKAVMERIFIAANVQIPATKFICVRYGNVLASRGSVIPLFYEQIRHGGPVTITDPNMSRFLLSINQAVDIIFAALQKSHAGEVYIPQVPAATVMNIAKALIADRKIKIKNIGVRPGEKMHEILVSEEECHHTSERGGHYVIHAMLPELRPTEVKTILTKEYSSSDEVMDYEMTVKLLGQHKLMPQDIKQYAEGGELLV